MPEPNTAGVLFDLDGTLVHSLPDIVATLNDVRAELNLPPLASEVIQPFIGKGGVRFIANCMTELEHPDLDGLLKRFRAIYAERPFRGGSVYPGVEETLNELRRRGMKLAIVTNKSTSIAKRTLDHYLPHFNFDLVAGCDSVTQNKPHPAHLLETLLKLSLDASGAVFVGDDEVDLACAERAGVRFFGAGYGFGQVKVDNSRRLSAISDLLGRLPTG